MNECGCGCGKFTRYSVKNRKSNRFVLGHNSRTKEWKINQSKIMKGNKHTLGYVPTEETRQKLRIAGMGKKNSFGYKHTGEARERMRTARKEQKPPTLGHKHTEKWKKQNSERMMGNKYGLGNKQSKEQRRNTSERMTGDKHPNWQGGISKQPYPFEFNRKLKNQIKSRDNHKCQNPGCWKTTECIHIHHIDYNKNNCCNNNLITICLSCNARANKNHEEWKQLYQKIIMEIAA